MARSAIESYRDDRVASIEPTSLAVGRLSSATDALCRGASHIPGYRNSFFVCVARPYRCPRAPRYAGMLQL